MLGLICLFKAKPQDLPASNVLAAILASLAVVINISSDGFNDQISNSFTVAVSYVVTFGIAIWVVLRIRKRASRWAQTASAVYGTTTLMSIVSWPAVTTIMAQAQNSSQQSDWFLFALLLFFAVAIWSLSLLVMIFREAMEISRLASFFITIAIVMIVPLVVIELFLLTSPSPIAVGQ